MSEALDWNAQTIAEFRANEGRVGGNFEGAPMVLVHHRGRKSGREYVNPMMYLPHDTEPDIIYVFASKGGAPSNPDWYRNVTASGDGGVEAIAQDDGPARGRELEIADILSFIKRAGVRNTLWLTADVHYTAAHYYDPNKAVFQDFEPFWEFVSGPLHAGTFPQNALDNTFGPQRVYVNAPSTPNRPPSEGLQFFGQVAIDGATQVMTVTLKDVDDRALWSTTLEPKLG